jgi:hypothetical protein
MPDVQNKRASDLEYNTAIALTSLGWDFVFQVPFFGGRNVSNGFVVDFIVGTVPLPTPLSIEGAYWHTNQQREEDKLIEDLFNSVLSSQYAQLVRFEEDDCKTVQLARISVLKEFGRAK